MEPTEITEEDYRALASHRPNAIRAVRRSVASDSEGDTLEFYPGAFGESRSMEIRGSEIALLRLYRYLHNRIEAEIMTTDSIRGEWCLIIRPVLGAGQ